MDHLSPTQESLLLALAERGGQAVSLSALVLDTGLDYATSWYRLRELEQAGWVTIERLERAHARPLLITLVAA